MESVDDLCLNSHLQSFKRRHIERQSRNLFTGMDKFIKDFNSVKTDIQCISLRSLTENTKLHIISFDERDTKFGRGIYVKSYLKDNIVGFFLPEKVFQNLYNRSNRLC
uniref:Uncharacterized protein n=1 Tax=Timema poppense TaxID=170557 RepID=A0A7R9DTN5_TIMPO|nr:unnamed protein product [Timema poppensis]